MTSYIGNLSFIFLIHFSFLGLVLDTFYCLDFIKISLFLEILVSQKKTEIILLDVCSNKFCEKVKSLSLNGMKVASVELCAAQP